MSLRCRISGFPRPTIRFEVNGTTITPGEGIYENFVVQEYYDQVRMCGPPPVTTLIPTSTVFIVIFKYIHFV